MRLHAPGAGEPAALQALSHPLGDRLAVFLPGPGTTHILAGAARWVYERVRSLPEQSLAIAAIQAQAQAAGYDNATVGEAILTLTEAKLLAQSAA